MDISLYSTEVSLEHIHWRDHNIVLDTKLFANFVYWLFIFCSVEIWYITSIENIVDIFKLLFIDYLGINEEERGGLIFNASLHQSKFHIFPPVTHRVTFDDFNLEDFVICNESCKSRQTLTSRTTHS